MGISPLTVAAVGLVMTLLALGCASPGGIRAVPSAAATAGLAATAAPATVASAGTGQSIVLTEWKVAVPATMNVGQAAFTITNSGTIEHELLVFKSDLDPSAYPKDGAGGIDEEGAGVSLISDGDNIAIGGSQTRTVDLSKPGKYLFVCNIPGHFQAGMFTVVVVK
jgi:uncharacterized cupredoxin-like copper-binding protein